MNVQELINILNTLPNKQQRICINGYEGGYCDIDIIEQEKIKLNVNTDWYYGPHEYVFGDLPFDELAYVIER